jgi:hypothetical protein
MHTSVIDDAGFYYVVSICLQYFSDASAQKIIPKVSQMQWLIRIGGGILDHDFFTVHGSFSKAWILVMFIQHIQKEITANCQI